MQGRSINREFIGFTLISGLISFGYNVVMTVIPLRMTDHGLSYGKIGSAMSAVAIGLMVIKLLIGHLSDILGTKKFILSSLAGLAVVSVLLARADEIVAFTVLMAALGIFRGIFLAVSGSYVMDMASSGGYGKIYGAVQSVSSLLASIGGIISGLLYQFREGEYALYICSFLLMAASVWAAAGLKSDRNVRRERLPILQIFKSINKRILIFCVLIFIQSFVAGPMWSFIIPMYCYNVLLFSPAKLGILMSMDELVSAPTYMLAGRIVDKVNVVKFNIIFLLLTALGGLLLIKSQSAVVFMIVFLLCSVSISCTFVGIPKERVGYIRKEQKGLELALISLCGSLGDSLGSNILGKVAEKYTINQCIYIFAASYVLMAVLTAVPVLFSSSKTASEKKS
ncbi:MFS transporter [Murimonas intestini]|uniref:Sugar phosphate permease n=1 Tax=Murimonas intestini TaxID=1337051 RepID=A0AB73T9M7_9FIRM|nr:MFS transporter [Murimonas intestini]MCR1839302.1 MFS transporter [Murimonas intestini]MCR1864597.1 MFS transporter [Murimonas intestini]MCR1882207.1 MFS transporter [Murimonas intestini]